MLLVWVSTEEARPVKCGSVECGSGRRWAKKVFSGIQETHDVFPSAVTHQIPRNADCTLYPGSRTALVQRKPQLQRQWSASPHWAWDKSLVVQFYFLTFVSRSVRLSHLSSQKGSALNRRQNHSMPAEMLFSLRESDSAHRRSGSEGGCWKFPRRCCTLCSNYLNLDPVCSWPLQVLPLSALCFCLNAWTKMQGWWW